MRPLPQLSVQQLSYLVAVSDQPTWAAAAADLHVTPSALSQGVAELERRLGIELFVRDGRRRLPRPEAEPVFDYARSVVVQTEDLINWTSTRLAGRSGRLRVGMIDVAAIHHFPDHLRRFTTERDDLSLELSVAPSSDLVRRITDGDLDLAIVVATPRPLPGLDVVPLISEPLAIYRPPGPKPRGGPATWGPWIAFPAASHTRSLIATALADLGSKYAVVAESHQPEVMLQMVRLGMGWTVLPVSQAEGGPDPLIRARKRPLLERRLIAVQRTDRLDHPAADALRDLLSSGLGDDGNQ